MVFIWYPDIESTYDDYLSMLRLEARVARLRKTRLELRRANLDDSSVHREYMGLRSGLRGVRRAFHVSTTQRFCSDLGWSTSELRKALRAGVGERCRRLDIMDRQTPSWYGELDEFVWRELCHLRLLREAETGMKWHIDHMLPLTSDRVSGFHCATNWQLLPAYLNILKLNKMMYTEHFDWMADIGALNSWHERGAA